MKKLAMMSAPEYGMRDMSHPAFWFSVKFGVNLSSGALIVMQPDEMARIVEDAEVRNIADLENRPCQIDVTDGVVTFVKIF